MGIFELQLNPGTTATSACSAGAFAGIDGIFDKE